MKPLDRLKRIEAAQVRNDKLTELHALLGIENGNVDPTNPLHGFAKAVATNGVDAVLAYVRALAQFGKEATP
jgi:hypothetical protein